MPVVLVPIHFDRDPANRIPSCARSIVLRPFLTNDFMTGVPIVPGSENLPTMVSIFMYILHAHSSSDSNSYYVITQVVDKMVRSICSIDGISRVLYDLTSKPPGTTEWE